VGVVFIPASLWSVSTQNSFIRRFAPHSISQIVRLLPLETVNHRRQIRDSQLSLKSRTRAELQPLLELSTIPPFAFAQPPVVLRDYQTVGINWLGLMERYNLEENLADDTGLGKTLQTLQTLQTLCGLAIHADDVLLEVCPPVVVAHWTGEMERFFPFMEGRTLRDPRSPGLDTASTSRWRTSSFF
jgi:SNF2 family DNA or RNA helicase